MEILKGIPVSPGVYIGEAFLQHSEEVRIPRQTVEPDQVEAELKRFEDGAKKVSEDIDTIRKTTEDQLGTSLGAILMVQTQLLKDEGLRRQIIDKIKNN